MYVVRLKDQAQAQGQGNVNSSCSHVNSTSLLLEPVSKACKVLAIIFLFKLNQFFTDNLCCKNNVFQLIKFSGGFLKQ